MMMISFVFKVKRPDSVERGIPLGIPLGMWDTEGSDF